MNRVLDVFRAGLLLTGASVLLACFATESEAVRTRFFRTEGYPAFRKLELQGVQLSQTGEVRLGPRAQVIEGSDARTVWRLAEARDKIVFSSGDQGKVYRVTGESVEVLATLYNYELFALDATASGDVYVAGAPAGTVVRISPDGEQETLFTVPEGLVFDLLAAPDGNIYVAAGERGRIYRIGKNGQTDVVAETGDTHVRRLAWSPDGNRLWAGTNGRGLVLEIDPGSGDVRIAYDAKEEEIVDLVPTHDGGWYFAANPGLGRAEDTTPNGAKEPVAQVYRLGADGAVRSVWECPERTVHDLIAEEDGGFLAATGGAATVYRVDENGLESVLWRAEEDQVLSLLRANGQIYAGTGNPGNIYRLGPQQADEATLLSDVLDAEDQARWGKLSWTADGSGEAIRVETRSGYTSLPDDSWSDWTGVVGGSNAAQVQSPPGRYLQWRATFDAESARDVVLRSVRVPYLAANRQPAIRSLSLSSRDASFRADRGSGAVSQVLPGGIQVDYSIGSSGRANTLPPEGVPDWVQQLRSIVWEANDPDNDRLTYTLEIRQVGEENFRLLARDHSAPAYTLETGLLPNGRYEVRVTASDALSNAPGEALTAVRVSPPFQVDNAPPTVIDLKARRDDLSLKVSGRAVDADSPLRAIQVSVDGGPFQGIHPADGLLDSAEEQFEVDLPLESEANGNWVVVQARDSAGNLGSFRAWLEP